jgi:L-amino acid N-acyltransferase YncA/protein-tyrosine-phosphatase
LRTLQVREARDSDLASIRAIYNQGIEDRVATLDEEHKSTAEMQDWWGQHRGRYTVVVAELDERVVGWASLNQYSHRCADRGVADLSVYVERAERGTGVGTALLDAIEGRARNADFHKIVLFALTQNDTGHRLYHKLGYRDIGVFKDQGRLDGRFVDVVAMEKILKPLVLFVCKHNTGRSQMAEAFFGQFAGNEVDVASAGTMAADRPDPGVVAAMAEVGIDISAARPKLLNPASLERADLIVTMGCDVEGVPRIDDDWGLPDPKGQTPERLREIREMVREKARALADRYTAKARV